MRSELVFGAMANVSNCFLLTKLASKATRRFHRPHGRIPETTNAVLVLTPRRRCWSTLDGRIFRATPQESRERLKLEDCVRGRAPDSTITSQRRPWSCAANDVSADLALRRDTPSHPVASRAEPPNSAQPFPIRSDQMPQLIPIASLMAANVTQTNLTKVQKIWQPMPARYRKAIVSKQMSL
jgi:hypothetical protein